MSRQSTRAAGEAVPWARWAGAKWDLIPQLLPLLPPRNLWAGHGYRSPFLGGGSDFLGFASDVRPAVLTDGNSRLIDTYLAIRDHVGDLIDELRALPRGEAIYYAVRDRFNRERDAPVAERAAWFIYLNKFCFNGLFRENADGDFNVGFDPSKHPTICDAENLIRVSRALRGADIRCCDFATSLAETRPGELVFLDPVYVPLPGKKSFTTYLAPNFSSVTGATAESIIGLKQTDHDRLAACLRDVDRIGAYFVACNSDTDEARRVYRGWDVRTILAPRRINSKADERGPVNELIFRNLARWT